ncbi:MAG: hypothetical protein AOY29_09785 [Alcanivorax borkumensis]|uniref:RiboL-PSP-HEPN domain-containing protein n=1 Tax=Alcanivorax borkumensis (strain ATCC 700651 / DSM 11573 / NCIMB 13689 / SK2) TaxID=393595 RepID=Q0VNJ3_ALCBS|nr:hypothetical protein [Alcanivorax borkumensis]OJH08406.1 MAG: hypothetical protein AOY29_09785 [Alcanivorax borkumensis]CAL17255.1 hypothetical protein ABO_1807 [Alcanivorax borkumensis SK2]
MIPVEKTTFGVPRFLAFIDLGYLNEAVKIAEEVFEVQAREAGNAPDQNQLGNINATRQSLYRSIFISAYACFEQNLDELCNMKREKLACLLKPNDLKDRGIARSIKYAQKALSAAIDTNKKPWVTLELLGSVRNHLVHYGPSFNDSGEHSKLYGRLQNSDLVSLRPMICFDAEQLEKVFDVLLTGVNDFSESMS